LVWAKRKKQRWQNNLYPEERCCGGKSLKWLTTVNRCEFSNEFLLTYYR
jgi:hypothetical protein